MKKRITVLILMPLAAIASLLIVLPAKNRVFPCKCATHRAAWRVSDYFWTGVNAVLPETRQVECD